MGSMQSINEYSILEFKPVRRFERWKLEHRRLRLAHLKAITTGTVR
jgi:hypothetical protein